jgi:large-conductance mechanosensitive channel
MVWLLVPSLIMLLITAFLLPFIMFSSRMERWECSQAYIQYGLLLCCINYGSLIIGFVVVFIAVGWIWGLVGPVVFWLVTNFVTAPIVHELF